MRWAGPTWETYAAGAEAAEDLLAQLGHPVAKAVNVLTRPGYDKAVRALLRAITRETHDADTAGLLRAAKELEANWTELTETARTEVVNAAAAGILRVPEVVIPRVEKVLYDRTGAIIATTKKDAAQEHGFKRIAADFSSRDDKVARYAAESQSNYIRDAYGRRAEVFSERARRVVADGIEKGFDNATIGKELQAAIVNPLVRQSAAYWESVASIHTARARSWGLLSSFDDAGITKMRWVSILDEVTSEQCRFLHGRVFSVARAAQKYQEVADSDDPSAVADIQPWLRTGRTVDGRQFIYAEARGQRQLVAHVEAAGYGKKDEVGDYSRTMTNGQLEALGCTTPPAHPRCRSTLVPE